MCSMVGAQYLCIDIDPTTDVPSAIVSFFCPSPERPPMIRLRRFDGLAIFEDNVSDYSGGAVFNWGKMK